jgi:dolichyl-phosphate beta-glucosyltransferase
MGERLSPAPELSVVIPAYNEAERLPLTLERVCSYLDRAHPDHELIVVDDGSADGTTEAARKALAARSRSRVLTLPENRGKGAAVRAGMLAARGRRVLFSDADLSTPIEEEARLAEALARGADVAIGSRAHPASRITRAQGSVRESMGRTFNVLVRLIGLSRFRDTQCGFKMFTREAAQTVFSRARIDGFAFDVEVLLLAARARLRIEEVPVEWRNDPASRLHMIFDSARMLRELVRIRLLYAGFPARWISRRRAPGAGGG